ncbi:MAG: hypothetical protein ACFFB3_09535 [Candidatus Hodarchaeota archaeon]
MSENYEKVIQILWRPIVVGSFIVFALAILATWIGTWQLVCVAGIIGGPIAGVQKARNGFFAGFLGTILAWLLFLNTSLWENLDIWDVFLQIATGLEGLGVIGVLITLLFGGLLGGVAGYFGAALLEFFPALKETISASMFKLKPQPQEDSLLG